MFFEGSIWGGPCRGQTPHDTPPLSKIWTWMSQCSRDGRCMTGWLTVWLIEVGGSAGWLTGQLEVSCSGRSFLLAAFKPLIPSKGFSRAFCCCLDFGWPFDNCNTSSWSCPIQGGHHYCVERPINMASQHGQSTVDIWLYPQLSFPCSWRWLVAFPCSPLAVNLYHWCKYL